MRENSAPKPKGLTDLIDRLDHASQSETVSVQAILEEIGERSYTPLILAISVLLVSPLSGIPTVPTISALLILLIGVQGLLRRRHLWLPGWLMRREIAGSALKKGVDWLRGPCRWIDRHSHPRLEFLTHGPARLIAFLFCIAIPISFPALELLPLVTSVGAAAVALLAFGLLTHDGLYTLLGYVVTGLAAAGILWLI